jgi:hypothetical protein
VYTAQPSYSEVSRDLDPQHVTAKPITQQLDLAWPI